MMSGRRRRCAHPDERSRRRDRGARRSWDGQAGRHHRSFLPTRRSPPEYTSGHGPIPGSAQMQSEMYQWLLAHGYTPSAAAGVIGNAAPPALWIGAPVLGLRRNGIPRWEGEDLNGKTIHRPPRAGVWRHDPVRALSAVAEGPRPVIRTAPAWPPPFDTAAAA